MRNPFLPYQAVDGNAQLPVQDSQGFSVSMGLTMTNFNSAYPALPPTDINSSLSTLHHPGSSADFIETPYPPVRSRNSTGLDSTLCLDECYNMPPWNPNYCPAFDNLSLFDAAFMASPVPQDGHWESQSAKSHSECHLGEWSSGYLPNHPFDNIYEWRLNGHGVALSPPATTSSQPNTPFDIAEPFASSPLPHQVPPCLELHPKDDFTTTKFDGKSPRAGRRQNTRKPTPRQRPSAEVELRTYEDIVLVESRKEGKSYKRILQENNFQVKESTLRGRHRALTKHSSQRPRKPQWTQKDVSD
ncbi:hypothetical protein C2857_006705 [Epichloe festucae Fl1]|uniref:Clr5 domain-containing protein n=1 Tax=Epichloe festucae (strain Fl1) TaxID=877507 RepID=A0A7S9KTN7_EPIFF|nr:hypothetical protein C2857_006705 [Epichloe festucae Fl1]